jgi:hypothetical protein
MNEKFVTSSVIGLTRWLALGQYRVIPTEKNNARSGRKNLPHNYVIIINYAEKTYSTEDEK